MNVSGETLAIDGGIPVRDERRRPWPTWPVVSENEWITRVEPALRQVYLSHTEGLSGESTQAFAAKFADYCGAAFGQMVPSGTCALAAALAGVLDLDAWGDGGEVILPN